MTNIVKNFAFTKTPLKGHYQFGSYFNVYPIPLNNNVKSKWATHYPCVIELTFEDDEIKNIQPFNLKHLDEMLSRSMTQTNKLIEITNLLSAVTNYRFFFYRHLESNWAMPMPDEITDELNNSSSIWTTKMFYNPLPKDTNSLKEFTKLKIEPVKLFDKRMYYYYEPLESKHKEIKFPSDIDLLIHNYISLSEEDKKVCDSAIYMLCNGLEIFDTMSSLSFISIVSSIETLVNYEFKDEKVEFECSDCKTLRSSHRQCKKCNRPIWGVGAKFREFLFKYVSAQPGAKKMYNSIYDIRSKIAHTEFIMNSENYTNWDFTDKTEEVSYRHLQAMQLGRRAISNWLRTKVPLASR